MSFRYLGLASETSFGTAASPIAFLDVTSVNIEPAREHFYRSSIARRAIRTKIEGPIREEGTIETDLNVDEQDKLLLYALGKVTTTSSPSVDAYKHELIPTGEPLPFTLEVGYELGTYARRIAGCFVTSLRIEAVQRELVTARFDITGRNESLVTPVSAPSFSTIAPLSFTGASVEIAGSGVGSVEAFRLTIENDIDTDAFVLGDQFLPAIRPQGLNVEGELELAFESWTEYRRFLGAVTATSFQEQSPFSLKLDAKGASTGSTDPGYENYRLTIDLPKVFYDTAALELSERDRVTLTFGFRPIYDDSIKAPCKLTIINTHSSL